MESSAPSINADELPPVLVGETNSDINPTKEFDDGTTKPDLVQADYAAEAETTASNNAKNVSPLNENVVNPEITTSPTEAEATRTEVTEVVEGTTPVKEEPRKKRRYNKAVINDDGLSGSYWKSPANITTEETASSRPRRLNAGSLMKTALQEFDRKKKGNSSTKTTTPRKSYTKAKGRKCEEKDSQDGGVVTKSATSTSASPGKSEVVSGFRAQPYEKPVTRHRGRPPSRYRRPDPGDEEQSDSRTDPIAKKSKPGSSEVTLTNPPIRTYGGRKPTSEGGLKQPVIRTFASHQSNQRDEELLADVSDSDTAGGTPAESRVSPSTALIAALSIPDELLPTSHEKFLDKFRETQEKSPTPPERRVHNLDEVVATFKSGARSSKAGSSGVAVVESEQNIQLTPAESSESDGESDSEVSSPSDEKENFATEAETTLGIVASIGAKATDEVGRLVKWGEDEKPVVIKLGQNQLSINDQIVTIDYTNYMKESDVEIPFDYDVIFEPEPKLEVPAPTDSATSAGNFCMGTISNPPSPKPATESQLDGESNCLLDACKMGCVCQSVKRSLPRAEHCGRPKCFLECSCLFNKDHVLIRGDEKNIRTRLRPRVTLLNWKHITKNGGADLDGRVGEGGLSKKYKLRLKKDHGKVKKVRDSEKQRLKAGNKGVESKSSKSVRGGQMQQQQPQQVYKPGPKSSKMIGYISPNKGTVAKSRGGAANGVEAGTSCQFKTPKRPPPLISTRFASNLPILRRIYSCQPCRVQVTQMPKKWKHWRTVEEKCANGVNSFGRTHSSPSVPFHVATSNFKIDAQSDLSYTIVRPNGSILALLYWEAHTKEVPRSIHPHAGNSQEISYPWLYLPLPSSGKVWLFYEIPKYPNDLPAIFLPELGVFLPTYKLMLMTFEANQTGKTSKLYFERNDESKMTAQGLLNFVYLVPNLPSLIVYGPVPKNLLKTVTRQSLETTLSEFEESDECKHVRKKLAAAGTDVEEVGVDNDEGPKDPWFEFAPEYEDDLVRDNELIDESIWQTHYQDFVIPANGYQENEDNDNDNGIEYEYEGSEDIYADDDEDCAEEIWEETPLQHEAAADAMTAEEAEMMLLEDESEFQEQEEITLMNVDPV